MPTATKAELYAPSLMLKVWFYVYALGMTSARRLEQRIREDLGLSYLAGGQRPDIWALGALRRRHGRALNDVFTQVVEMARELGLGRLGTVAIDSTRVRAWASRDRIDTEQRLRNERAKIRRWQKACDGSDRAGVRVAVENLERRLADIPQRLERLRKSGQTKLSRRDGEARFLRERGGYALGYTAKIAVSEDHLIVAHRVTLNPCAVPALVPLVKEVEERTGASPGKKALADAGFYSTRMCGS
jgi:hypothetical protein